jgi:serine protease Do
MQGLTQAFSLVPAVVGNSDAVQVGDRVVLIGSPQGLERSVSDGLISAIRDSGDGYRLFSNKRCRIARKQRRRHVQSIRRTLGVVSSKLTGGENLNFGIPVNYARGLDALLPVLQKQEQPAAREPRP